jgi:hypothetical protein
MKIEQTICRNTAVLLDGLNACAGVTTWENETTFVKDRCLISTLWSWGREQDRTATRNYTVRDHSAACSWIVMEGCETAFELLQRAHYCLEQFLKENTRIYNVTNGIFIQQEERENARSYMGS